MELVTRLVDVVVSTRPEDIPAKVRAAAKRSFLDYLGVTVGGAAEPCTAILRDFVADQGGRPQASAVGAVERCSATQAALVNGTAAHALDFDDTHLPTILHGCAPIASAALAVAELRGCCGRELLAAFVLGFEVAARVGLAVTPEHYGRGWHITGTVGALGAAAAASYLLRLDRQRTLSALGVASTAAAGLREMFGTMCKPWHAGRAAEVGVAAGLLAERGFTSARDPLEGRRGFCRVLGEGAHLEQALFGLGERFEIERDGLKPYPCGVVTHAAIDAVLALKVDADQLAAVRLRVHPYVVELTGKRAPATGLEGKFSVYHCVAAALKDQSLTPGHFTDAAVARADLASLRRRIQVEPDPTLPLEAVVAEAELQDGRRLVHRVEAARGSAANPLSDEEVRAKFFSLVEPALGRQRAEELAHLAERIEDAIDVHSIGQLLRAAASQNPNTAST